MEKINIAELLKACPNGMELDCTMYDKVILVGVDNSPIFPIKVRRKDGCLLALTKYGQYSDSDYAKCVIFPKGKTTWRGFVPPCKFKDGDVITSVFQGVVQGTGIFDYEEESEAWIHVCINLNNEFFTGGYLGHVYDLRFATEEEKEKLFGAIKANGYKWNAETKTLEKLINKNKFVVGTTITNGKIISKIVSRDVDSYRLEDGNYVFFNEVHNWELVSNKFDINTLKPFESGVLVRNDEKQYWMPAFWGCKRADGYTTTFGWCKYCIPFEGNEHLLETNNDCDEYFKTWE